MRADYGDHLARYQKQLLQPGSVRVFEVQQADTFDREVGGDLLPVSDQQWRSTTYNALSYGWGKPYADGSHLSETIL